MNSSRYHWLIDGQLMLNDWFVMVNDGYFMANAAYWFVIANIWLVIFDTLVPDDRRERQMLANDG